MCIEYNHQASMQHTLQCSQVTGSHGHYCARCEHRKCVYGRYHKNSLCIAQKILSDIHLMPMMHYLGEQLTVCCVTQQLNIICLFKNAKYLKPKQQIIFQQIPISKQKLLGYLGLLHFSFLLFALPN